MNAWAQSQGQPGLGYIFWKEEDGKVGGSGPLAKNIGEERTRRCASSSASRQGDACFFVAGDPAKFYKFAGEARTRAADELNLIDRDRFEMCWIVDFPFFEYNEEEKKIDFAHNPFSMPQGGLEALEGQDPLSIKAFQYDAVCNGFEIASGSIRNQSPELMVKAFEKVGLSQTDVEERFGGLTVPSSTARLRMAAALSVSTRGHAAGRCEEPARNHAVPDEPAGAGPLDERAIAGNADAASRTGAARRSVQEGLIVLKTLLDRVRAAFTRALAAALAAAFAFWIAREWLGHSQPVFAAISALICLSPGISKPRPSGTRVMVGVTIGILVGEVALLVPHDFAEIRLASATFIAMILATTFGLPAVVPIQAGASAMLVLLMGPQVAGFVRFVDVIVGVATGVAVALVFFRERLKLLAVLRTAA